MKYEMISADCHLDLCWLPPDLFTSRASAALKDRMPYTKEGPRGPVWVTNKGSSLGIACGMGYSSFFSQLATIQAQPTDVSGASASMVVTIKGVALAFGVIGLVTALMWKPTE